MTDEQHDAETGEIKETASQRALKAVQPRRHWDRLEGLTLKTVAEDKQSQFELAFLAAQMEIQTVIAADAKAAIPLKDKDGKVKGSKEYAYTTLGQLMDHVRPILNKHGFTFKQGSGSINRKGIDGGHQLYMPIFLRLVHVATNESETFITEMPLTKLDPQSLKSAKTYGKRQLIEDSLGIASADDDAISAMTERNFWRDDESNIVAGISERIRLCKTIEDLSKWGRQNKEHISGLSQEAYDKCTTAYQDRLNELKEAMEAQKSKEASQEQPETKTKGK